MNNVPQSANVANFYLLGGQLMPQFPPRRMIGYFERTNKPIQVVKVGRNDPCPCGSGQKFKRCHG